MTSALLSRRRALGLGAAAALSAACSRTPKSGRCAYCGMKIDPSSPWLADLVQGDGGRVHFDTPRCALLAWRTGRVAAQAVSLREFYDRAWRSGTELRFALGSDVVGPMGADVVPLDPSRADKFVADHHATRVVGLDDLTASVLESLP